MNPITMAGPYWPEAIRALSVAVSAYGLVTVEACGLESGRHYTTTLPQDQWDALHPPSEFAPTFRADPSEFALAFEAQRLQLAHSCDPLLATNNALIHLLPHQIEAVYSVMLPQPAIRHLLAQSNRLDSWPTTLGGQASAAIRCEDHGVEPELLVLEATPSSDGGPTTAS